MGNGAPFPLAVFAVHQRSLSGIEGSDGPRVRAKRFAQSVFLAAVDLILLDAEKRSRSAS